MKLFVVLVCAHILGDFLLQPDCLVKNKHCFLVLGFHSVIHAVLVWLVVGQAGLWPIPLIVLGSHFLFDFLKQKSGDTALVFMIDQFLHLAVLAGVAGWFCCTDSWAFFDGVYRALVLVSGFIAVVQGSGFLIAKVAQRLVDENHLDLNGLKGGGQYIGQLERALIFLLMLIGQPAGIGFLVAAKSILRFKESEEQKLAEYVLIGTLLSFSLAIAMSALTLKALTF